MNEVTRRLSSGAPSFPTADRLDVGHFASSIPFLPRSERSEWSTGERSEPDMEEEIIGNRWKELDYDGYCPPTINLRGFSSRYTHLTAASFKDFSLVIYFQLNSSLQRLLIMKTKKLIS